MCPVPRYRSSTVPRCGGKYLLVFGPVPGTGPPPASYVDPLLYGPPRAFSYFVHAPGGCRFNSVTVSLPAQPPREWGRGPTTPLLEHLKCPNDRLCERPPQTVTNAPPPTPRFPDPEVYTINIRVPPIISNESGNLGLKYWIGCLCGISILWTIITSVPGDSGNLGSTGLYPGCPTTAGNVY